MSILEKIVDKKKERLSAAKLRKSRSELISKINGIEKPKNFQQSIKKKSGDIKLIAEIKKASPSRGIIRTDFDHIRIASIYEEKKVDAISVITEEDFFHGKIEYLTEVTKNVTMPVLRKEFIFDEYQIYETRACMADAVLLIAAMLGEKQAEEYLDLAKELGMSVLFEVHDMKELEMALRINTPIIGINNRDLKTMKIDLATSLNLKKEIPADRVVISESGISSREDVMRIESADIDAMLVGTCLMNSDDIGAKIDHLRGNK
jgi:indole-3-glycerol phosphate synthase